MKKIIILIVVLIVVWLIISIATGGSDAPEAETGQAQIGESIATDVLEDVLTEDAYVLVSEESSLRWAASRIVGSDHAGTVTVSEGSVEIDDDMLTGSFVIDMTTIADDDNNENFLGHVRSDDFFAVDQFPTAELVLTGIEATDTDDEYMVTANLTIRDITNSITFPATITGADGLVSAQAFFTIDRTLWDITFDSSSVVQNLGDKAIRDEIEFDLSLVLEPQEN